MKQVLLSVTSVRPKILVDKLAQSLRTRTPSGEIKLTQSLHHPNIHRKRRRKPIAEEQNTIGDLGPDTGQLDKLLPSLLQRTLRQLRQVEVALCHAPGRR